MQSDNQLLVIEVPAALKDDVVDQLMAIDFISGFGLTKKSGYSKSHSLFDINEQVEGYRNSYQFEVLHSKLVEKQLLAALSPVCEKIAARYWIIPVLSAGNF